MLGLGAATRIYVAVGSTDMRKGFEGLYGLVRDQLGLDPLSGHLCLFCNKGRNRLKVLYWTAAGCGFAQNGSNGGASAGLVTVSTRLE